jgi:hypothetical protein
MLLAACLLLTACAASHRPPPFEIHTARTLASYHFGTPLSGQATGDVSKIDFQAPLELQMNWFSLERYNCTFLPLVASQASLVTARLADQAVLPTTSLTSNARVEWLGAADPKHAVLLANPSRIFPIGRAQAILPAGITASFRAVETGGYADHTLGRPEPRYVELDIARIPGASANSPEQLQVALAIQDNPVNSPDNLGYPLGVYQREVAILNHPLTKPPISVLLVVPFSFAGPYNHAVGIFLTLTAAGPNAQNAIAQCKADLQVPQAIESGPLWTLGLHRALRELDDPERRRAVLVYLAEQGDASICEDVAMLADDSLLQQIAESIKSDAPAAIDAANLPQYAWVLDRSAVEALQPHLTKADLPPELFAVLTQHFGEPGRHSAALDDIMHSCTGEQELQTRLVAENYIYLEDSSPSSRVRAFQWLSARKLAPAGFDPLGSPKARREALDQALSGAAQ